MAQVTLTIPDADVDDVFDALNAVYRAEAAELAGGEDLLVVMTKRRQAAFLVAAAVGTHTLHFRRERAERQRPVVSKPIINAT